MIVLAVALTPIGLTVHALPQCAFKRVGKLCEAIEQNSTPTSLRQVIIGDDRSCIQDDSVIHCSEPAARCELHLCLSTNFRASFIAVCQRLQVNEAQGGSTNEEQYNAGLVRVVSAYTRVQIIA